MKLERCKNIPRFNLNVVEYLALLVAKSIELTLEKYSLAITLKIYQNYQSFDSICTSQRCYKRQTIIIDCGFLCIYMKFKSAKMYTMHII